MGGMCTPLMPDGEALVFLDVVSGADKGSTHGISAPAIHVGRGGVNDDTHPWLILEDQSVSRRHALLVWDKELSQYHLENHSRTNLTQVNGVTVHRATLRAGDTLRLGNVLIVLRAGAAPNPVTTDAAHPTATRASLPPGRQGGGPAAARPSTANGLRHPAPQAGEAQPTRQLSLPWLKRRTGRLRRADKAQIFSHLAVMLEVGIPLTRALAALGDRGSTPAMRAVAWRLGDSLQKGMPLSTAMKGLQGVFSPLHVHSVRAGELSGRLAPVLRELGAWEERDLSLTRAVTSGLTYPLTVFTCGLLLVFYLGNHIFASLIPVFTSSGRELPWVTRALIRATQVAQDPWVLGGALVAAWMGYRLYLQWKQSDSGRLVHDGLAVRLPVFGVLQKKLFVARFCGHLRLMYDSGIPLLQGLETASAVTNNAYMRRALEGAGESLRNGEELVTCLGRTGQFPRLMLGMVAVGESTQAMGPMLKKLADLYDSEVYDALERMTALLEPVIVTVMGVAIGIVVVATMLPMYQLIAS